MNLDDKKLREAMKRYEIEKGFEIGMWNYERFQAAQQAAKGGVDQDIIDWDSFGGMTSGKAKASR